MPTTRAFIAIPLPEGIQKALGELQGRLKKDLPEVRWTKPENMHLTLKFLGEVGNNLLGSIEKALHENVSSYEAFSCRINQLDTFPPKGPPRVIWVGFQEKTGTLSKLASSIDQTMKTFSFPKEKRAFTPHLTLGRFRPDQKPKLSLQSMKDIIQKEGSTDIGAFEVGEVFLVKSDLTPKGPIYSNLARVKLKART